MRHSRWSASAPTVAALLLGSWGLHALAPEPLAAQYFGRNKVQYEDFDFRVLELPHWDLYFYPGQEESISDIARMAERWYERFARTFQHEFERTKPLIMYADHPDFQQTNTLSGFIGEGTGGVTESLKNRIIMPQTGSYQDTDHVLGHEIVHAFQYNIAQSRRGGGIQGLGSLPLWLVEGMAEYLSVGRESPLTGMWLRDALREDDFPTIRDLSEGRRYFPYRFGQALWAYVGGTYGDDAVTQLFRRALRIGFPAAIEQVLGVQHDTLSADWKRSVERAYGPLMADRTPPDSTGTLLLAPSTGAGTQNLGPALSPDGRYITYLSEQDLFSIDLFLADANTGRVIRKLSSATSSPHFDALRYIESAGTWSPDGTQFAFAVFKGGDNAITIVNVESGNEVRTFHPLPSGAINNPSWSPDGRTIAFSGTVGGISDLYLWDLESDGVRRLTHDKHGDFHPDWSPDGSTIVFASDRGPETDFDRLVYSKFRLSFVDVESGHVSTPEIFGDTRHSDPHYGPEGRVYFLSAPDGFSDVFRYDPGSETTERITRIATGVSGHTPMAPALSVAEESGDLAFSVFSGFEFHVVRMAASPPTTTVATAPTPEQARGRRLPPQEPDRFSRVSTYLGDPDTGLEPPGAFALSEAESYQSVLALDYVGQPSFGVGTDRFGNYVGGGASAYFSDMLGNRVFGAAAQAQGTVRDIGGAVFYADLGHRWNRAIAVSHIPYVLSYVGHGFDERGPYLGTDNRPPLCEFGGRPTELSVLADAPFRDPGRLHPLREPPADPEVLPRPVQPHLRPDRPEPGLALRAAEPVQRQHRAGQGQFVHGLHLAGTRRALTLRAGRHGRHAELHHRDGGLAALFRAAPQPDARHAWAALRTLRQAVRGERAGDAADVPGLRVVRARLRLQHVRAGGVHPQPDGGRGWRELPGPQPPVRPQVGSGERRAPHAVAGRRGIRADQLPVRTDGTRAVHRGRHRVGQQPDQRGRQHTGRAGRAGLGAEPLRE